MQKRKSKRILSVLLFTLVFMPLWGCLQTQNSSSGDRDQFGELPTEGEISAEFAAVRAIFASSCVAPCHTYSSYKTEEQFIAEGLVVPGDPDNSEIYTALTGATSPTGRKDMPIGSPLTMDELAVFTTWINSITP